MTVFGSGYFVYNATESKFHIQCFLITILAFSFIYGLLYFKLYGWPNPIHKFQVKPLSNQAKMLTNDKLKLTEIAILEIRSQIKPVWKVPQSSTKATLISKRPQQFFSPKPVMTLAQILTGKAITNLNANEADDISYFLSTRYILLLVIRKMNAILDEFRAVQERQQQRINIKYNFACTKWWATVDNDVISHEILNKASNKETHILQFIAENKFERRYFKAVIEININSPPNEINIISIQRLDKFRQRLRIYENFNLTTPGNVTTNFTLHVSVKDICSSQLPPETGYDNLQTWPAHSSFFAGDYLNNYKDFGSIFHILPKNSSAHFCTDDININLLVLVSSAPKHFAHRETIRSTYGAKENLQKNKANVIFFFGRVLDYKLQDQLEEEAKKYQDIVQVNFMDSYHNLTLSHLSMFAFVYHVCSGKNSLDPTDKSFNAPRHVLKVDDDYVQNLPIAYKVALANADVELIGFSYCGTKPVRRPYSKYYTPKYMYIGNFYPGYLTGATYLFRTDIIPKFLKASLFVPFVHMDDVYITGILAAALKIYPRHSNLIGYARIAPEPKNVCRLKKMVNSYMFSLKDMKAQWELLNSKERMNNCTSVTTSELKVYPLTANFIKYCRYKL